MSQAECLYQRFEPRLFRVESKLRLVHFGVHAAEVACSVRCIPLQIFKSMPVQFSKVCLCASLVSLFDYVCQPDGNRSCCGTVCCNMIVQTEAWLSNPLSRWLIFANVLDPNLETVELDQVFKLCFNSYCSMQAPEAGLNWAR